MDLSVMMLHFNRLEYSKIALWYYLQNVYYPHYLTLVDNGSKDGTAEWLKELEQDRGFWSHYPYIVPSFVFYNENKMYATPVNNFWKNLPSDVKYVGRILNDVIIDTIGFNSKWVEELIRVLNKIPKLGIICSGDGPQMIEGLRKTNPKRILEIDGEVLINEGVNGHLSIMKKEIIEKVGLIEERGVMAPAFWYGYVMQKGYFMCLHPNIITHHIQLDPILSLENTNKYKKYAEVLHGHKMSKIEHAIPSPNMYNEVKII